MSDDQDIAELMAKRSLKDQRLTSIIGDRLRPGGLEQTDERPGVWYEITTATPFHDLEGASGGAASRVRFGCESYSKREANAIAAILKDLWDGFAQQYVDDDETVYVNDCTLENKWDTREQPAPGSSRWIYTRNVDFSVNHTEPDPTLAVVTVED